MKHEAAHKLDVACLDCIRVHLEQKDKLLIFVKKISKMEDCDCSSVVSASCLPCLAFELLKELDL